MTLGREAKRLITENERQPPGAQTRRSFLVRDQEVEDVREPGREAAEVTTQEVALGEFALRPERQVEQAGLEAALSSVEIIER